MIVYKVTLTLEVNDEELMLGHPLDWGWHDMVNAGATQDAQVAVCDVDVVIIEASSSAAYEAAEVLLHA